MGKSANGGRRALSPAARRWQLRASAVCAAALCLPSPVWAAPGGDIGTLPLGHYVCELPGDALGAAGRAVPDDDFTIRIGSTYQAHGGRGTYLRTGNDVVLTGGPRKGERYRLESENFLRRVGTGGEAAMRCVASPNNSLSLDPDANDPATCPDGSVPPGQLAAACPAKKNLG